MYVLSFITVFQNHLKVTTKNQDVPDGMESLQNAFFTLKLQTFFVQHAWSFLNEMVFQMFTRWRRFVSIKKHAAKVCIKLHTSCCYHMDASCHVIVTLP